MTNSEAIQVLKQYLDMDSKIKSEYLEAQRMAIKALEQEPKTGRWISIDATHSQCDKCLAVFEIVSANGEANFCPNCGAYMAESEDRK